MPLTVMRIYKIRLITIPTIQNDGFEPNFKIKCKNVVFYDFHKNEEDGKNLKLYSS